jgi:hypothetical protein
MCRFVKIFFKVALGLTSVVSLLIPLQVQAVAHETIKPGAVLLAQSAEPQKEPTKSPVTAGGQEEEKLKQEKLKEQEIQMKKQAPKTRGLQQPPAAAGTKKIGGQAIRAKEFPEGE